MTLDRKAEKALAQWKKTDREAAKRIQPLLDEILAGRTPHNAKRMTVGIKCRAQFGTIPWTVSTGKLRVVFIPEQTVLAIGYRRDVYTILDGKSWGN